MSMNNTAPTSIDAEFARRDGAAFASVAPVVSPGPDPAVNIRFLVQGEPKPQPRPRAFARKMASGHFAARVFDAGTAEAWKSQVAAASQPFLPPSPYTGALCVTLVFDLPRPKGHYTTKGALTSSAPAHPTGRNDVDNLAKAVLDALTQIGLWQDDGQVVQLSVAKQYAQRGGALIIITSMEGRSA